MYISSELFNFKPDTIGNTGGTTWRTAVAYENGFEYVIQKGDTLSGIAKKFGISDWEIIYGHEENRIFRSNNPNFNKISIGDCLFIPDPTSVFMPEALVCAAVMPGNALFFDTHMHIQSNNCVPLPLQWGMVKRVANLRAEMLDREALNLVSALRNRFGAIGAFSTDLIAGVYFGTGVATGGTNEKERTSVWKKIVTGGYGEDLSKYFVEKEILAKQTEDSHKLLVQGSDNAFPDFEKTTHYYFKNNSVKRIAVCHMMDMSYSHFWGTDGLPINIPLGNAAVYIDDFIVAGAKNKNKAVKDSKLEKSSEREGYYATYTSMTEGVFLAEWSHLFAAKCPDDDFSFRDQYRRFFETKISIPGGVKPVKESFLAFSHDPKVRALDERLLQKKFVHIVEDLPASEVKLFENYNKQKLRTIKAAMTWPLQLLPFFHFDPRRHVSAEKRTALLDKLDRDHAFYRISLEHPYIKLTPDEIMNNKTFLSGLVGELSSVTAARKELFLDPSSTTGVFWGVKMYPRLGYAPDDFDRYPQLDALYTTCQANQIPITAHCARGPMCIPDYINYSRYDHKNKKPPPVRAEDNVNYMQHEFWFADNFTTAANWEKVLDKYPDLKVDLAHFGGMDLWILFSKVKDFDGEFATLDKYFDAHPGKMPKEVKPEGTSMQKQEQLASLYWTWIKKTAILCQTKKNVYTDLACFVLPDEEEKGKNGVPIMELTAKNIAMLLKMYPNLKNKLLVGSDWFMAENEGTVGVGPYFSKMFQMLRMVSDLVEPKFDAWHQFALINPLKFLGLWKEGGMIDVEKCEKYVGRLAGWVGDEEMKDECMPLPKPSKIRVLGSTFINMLKFLPILKNSDEIKNEEKQLIILDTQK